MDTQATDLKPVIRRVQRRANGTALLVVTGIIPDGWDNVRVRVREVIDGPDGGNVALLLEKV